MASSKNIGDQIFNAVQNAVDSQDFQQSSVNHRKKHRHRRRGNRVRPKLCIGWHSTRPGTICPRTGQEASRRTDGNDLREPQRATQRWHRARRFGRRFGRAGPRWHNFQIGAGSILVGSILAAATVAGGALFAMGIKRLNLVNRFERYRDAIGLRDFCYLDEIAASTADTTENVRQNVKAMLSHGLFSKRRRRRRKLPGAYQRRLSAIPQGTRQGARKKQQRVLTQSEHSQLDAETQALLARGNAYIAQIRESNKAIPNPEFSKKIDQIEHVVR